MAGDSGLMAKLQRVIEGLARPMPTVAGKDAGEANQILLQLMDQDELRPLIRATNLVVADKRLKKPMNALGGIQGLGGPLLPGMTGMVLPNPGDDLIMGHELGHVRQSMMGLPVRNDQEVERPLREVLLRQMRKD